VPLHRGLHIWCSIRGSIEFSACKTFYADSMYINLIVILIIQFFRILIRFTVLTDLNYLHLQ
jgi:hypothetical protein